MLPGRMPIGVVIFFHGAKQHGQSREIIPFAASIVKSTTVAWYALDQQGHGRSGKLGDPSHALPAGVARSGQTMLQDAKDFVGIVLNDGLLPPGLPFVVAGHSMGGPADASRTHRSARPTVDTPAPCITAHRAHGSSCGGSAVCVNIAGYLQDTFGTRFRGIAVTEPACLYEPVAQIHAHKRGIVSLFEKVGRAFPRWVPFAAAPLRDSVRRDSAFDVVSGDALRFQSQKKDGLPMATLAAATRIGAAEGTRYLSTIRTPLLVSHGTHEDPRNAMLLVHLTATPEAHKQLHMYTGATHNLYADLQRTTELQRAWGDFITNCMLGRFPVEPSADS